MMQHGLQNVFPRSSTLAAQGDRTREQSLKVSRIRIHTYTHHRQKKNDHPLTSKVHTASNRCVFSKYEHEPTIHLIDLVSNHILILIHKKI